MLILLTAVVLTVSAPADGQYRSPYQTAKQYGNLRFQGRSERLGRLTASYESRRYSGARTRLGYLTGIAPFLSAGQGLLTPEPQSMSPIRQALDQRHLLGPRSVIAKRIAGRAGRLDYVYDDTGEWRGAVPPSLPDVAQAPSLPTGAAVSMEDRLSATLQQQADEYFELGLAYCRAGKLIEAANCLALVKEMERDTPRAFVADVFVSLSSDRYFRAMLSLRRALEAAKTLDDLRIDRFIERLYPGDDIEAQERAFQRQVESVNLFVNANPGAHQQYVLLAYFAWLNGDLGTAISAAETAEKGQDAEFSQEIARFRKLLQETRNAPSAPSTGS